MQSLFGWLSERANGIGLLIGVMSALYAIYAHRQNRYPKRLIYDTGPTFALAKVYEDDAPIAMSYAGVQTKAAFRTLFLIWNRGSAPIEASDVLEHLRISWTPDSPVINSGIVPKDAGSTFVVKRTDDLISVELQLIRANEALLLYLDSVHKPATLTTHFELKHTGSATRFRITDFLSSSFAPVYIAVMVTIMVLLYAPITLRRHYPIFEITETSITIFMIAIFVIPAAVGVVTHLAVRMRVSPTVRRFHSEQDQSVGRMSRS